VAAIEAWRMAMKYGMKPRIALTRIGDAYFGLKDYEQAETHYKKALALGYDKYAYLGMAKIHAEKNQRDKASKIFEMLFDKMPGDLRVAAEYKEIIGKEFSA
jgi:tetratricopeptide (TPR) repeat protein